MPKGRGVFIWADGSINAETWGKDFNFQVDAARKRSSMDVESVDLDFGGM